MTFIEILVYIIMIELVIIGLCFVIGGVIIVIDALRDPDKFDKYLT